MFDQMLLLPSRPVEKLDIFLCSNGGSGTVPWRLVALFREYAKKLCVLIPYRAYSAASLLALGADEIVMHPFAELGPIDPTVSNEFNPREAGTGRPLGISVEDVSAYVNFIKSTVGITHEDELVKAIEILAHSVHPLALGNVERFLAQSRMIARKLLRTHMKQDDEHTIKDIVENMASKLYFHGHPINRQEAKQDLRLTVNSDLPADLESAMWELYRDYEEEFANTKEFNPAGDLGLITKPGETKEKEYDLLLAMIESARKSSRYLSRRRFTMMRSPNPAQTTIHFDVLAQGWQ
ncbi:MAG: SDH family Clp fold serine proteinase [Candidatus Brocadiia bacterium]